MCGGGGTPATQVTTTKVPGYIEDASKAAIDAGRQYSDKYGASNATDQAIYARMKDNAAYAELMMPFQKQLIESLYGGGGLGEGAQYIRDAYGQAAPAYSQYLQSDYLDPMTNPYLQPSIASAQSDAYNQVADRFHKAGRSFSGAEGAAYGTASTNAAMPLLLGQYNQNVGAQQTAAQGLLTGAAGSSAGLDAAQQGRLKAQMAASGQIDALNTPENILMAIQDMERKRAQEAISAKTGFMGGLPFGQTVTGTQQPATDPFQTLLGGGLGLLGMFM